MKRKVFRILTLYVFGVFIAALFTRCAVKHDMTALPNVGYDEQITEFSAKDTTRTAAVIEMLSPRIVDSWYGSYQLPEVLPVTVSDTAELVFDNFEYNRADSIINYALRFIGCRYQRSGNGPDRFDCSGFTSYVFRHFGISLNRASSAQFYNGSPVKNKDLQPGDLVFYEGRHKSRRIGHVGIVLHNYADKGYFTFIHASCSNGVTVSSSRENYYSSRYLSACRVL